MPRHDDEAATPTPAYYYGEGNGFISIIEDINKSAIVTEYGVGESLGQKTVSRGSAFYSTSSTGKLSFLNNFLGVFETEVDNESGDAKEKVWEWK
jgi:hypothetical protein